MTNSMFSNYPLAGVFFYLFLLSGSVSGEQELQVREKELGRLQQDISVLDTEIKVLQLEKDTLYKKLQSQEMQYGRLAVTVGRLKKEAARQQDVLNGIVQKVKVTRQAISQQKHELENQVKSAHAMGNKERLRVLLNQQDPSTSGRMLIYYGYLNKARLEKIHGIEEKLRELAVLEHEQQQESGRLNQILDQRVYEQNAMQTVRQKRQRLLITLEQRYSDKKSRLKQLENDEKTLRQLIADLQQQSHAFLFQQAPAKPFHKLKGHLPWPLQGHLKKKFGSPRSESRWDGVLISAKEGAPIHAVNHGRVVYADWLRGYGLLTIIDHGKGYMTLYAFNQSLFKSEGDWVEAGDVVASVGNSGGRTQAALYFGIRKKGKPVDPVKWCRKLNNGRVG